MLLLKVRDVQSKTHEINNTHVCLAEFDLYKCAGKTGARFHEEPLATTDPEMKLNCKHPFF